MQFTVIISTGVLLLTTPLVFALPTPTDTTTTNVKDPGPKPANVNFAAWKRSDGDPSVQMEKRNCTTTSTENVSRRQGENCPAW